MKRTQIQMLKKTILLILVSGMIGCNVNNDIIDDETLNDATYTISNYDTKLNERLKEMDGVYTFLTLLRLHYSKNSRTNLIM